MLDEFNFTSDVQLQFSFLLVGSPSNYSESQCINIYLFLKILFIYFYSFLKEKKNFLRIAYFIL